MIIWHNSENIKPKKRVNYGYLKLMLGKTLKPANGKQQQKGASRLEKKHNSQLQKLNEKFQTELIYLIALLVLLNLYWIGKESIN